MKQLVSSDNGITFTCNMSLNPNATNNIPAQVDKTEANNIPYYRYSWNYTTTVLCKLDYTLIYFSYNYYNVCKLLCVFVDIFIV